MKKWIALLLASVMTLGMLAACAPKAGSGSSEVASSTASASASAEDEKTYYNKAGLPIVNEPINISVMGYKDGGGTEWGDLELFKRAAEETGVNFDFELYDAEQIYDDKVNLAITTGDYPDVFMRRMRVQDEEANGKDGTFIDLTNLIENNMPNLKALMDNDAYLKAAMTATDGKIYSLPYYYKTATGNPHMAFMFDGWLKEAGFDDVPETVDEFYDLLVALDGLDINGNGDMNDDIPLGAWDTNIMIKFLVPAFTGYTTQSNDFDFDVNLETGKVVFIPTEPGYKEFLLFANKLYKEKLLDQEIYTQNLDQWLAKLKENRIGIFNASPTATDPEKANGTAISLKPLTSATSPVPVAENMPFLVTGMAVITDKCEYPEAVARWFDLFYAKDDESMAGLNGRTLFLGYRGEHWDFVDAEKTQYKFKDPITNMPDINATVSVNMWMPSYLDFEVVPTGSKLFEQKVAAVIKNQIPYMRYGLPAAHMRLTEEEAAVRDRVVMEASQYTKQMTAQFITGVLDIEKEYDTFIANYKTMGVDDATAAYQSAYDRWLEAVG